MRDPLKDLLLLLITVAACAVAMVVWISLHGSPF